MKRSLLILGLLILGIGHAFSQNYYYYTSVGSAAPYVWNANNGTATPTEIISAPSNDVLSAVQTIPFTWKFYGQNVTQYRASDNGYITFDPNATTSSASPVSLPSKTAPRNAIFAFWTDLNIQTVSNLKPPASVRTWTYGTAPNRIHVIEWYYVAKQGVTFGNSNLLIFSIRLYESGGFDIDHTTDIGSFNNGVIGAQDTSGTIGDMVDGSPFLGAPNPAGTGDPSLDLIYNFKYGIQPVLDASLSASIASSNVYYRRTVPTFTLNDNAVAVSGSIINNGSVPITSFTFNYSVDGGTVQSDKITGISVPRNGGTYSFYSKKLYTATGVGQYHNVNIWIKCFNDSLEDHENKDSLTKQLFVINGGTFNIVKKPLIEEITGAWCGWCPDGHLVATSILENNPDAIVVTQHTTDSMMTSTSADFANYFGGGLLNAPLASIDRHYFTEDPQILSGQQVLSFSRAYWAQGVSEQLNTGSVPVKIDIVSKTWDSVKRQITFTVNGTFSDYAGGNLMLNAYIVEDSCRGSNSEPYSNQYGWNQHNYISSKWSPAVINDPASPLYNEPASMIGYKHNHVVRKSLTGSWGVPLTGTNPAIASPNQAFTKTFTYTMPKETKVKYTGKSMRDDFYSTYPGRGVNKPDLTYLVAFVSNFNSTDPTYNEVLNATQAPLLGWSAGIAKYNQNVDKISLYPNPASNNTNVEYTLLHNTNLTVDVYNMMGQKVLSAANGTQAAGLHTLSIDATNLSNGMYFVTFTSNGEKTTKQLMIQK